jgi:rhodanese-related sulfurtransferase
MEIIRSDSRHARVPNARLGLLLTGLIVAGVALLSMRDIEWFLLKRALRQRFRQINWTTTGQLADWLADNRRPPPVLLDVRTQEEWDVSHLPGARRVDPQSTADTAAAGISRDTPVVTYCAIGFRSAELTQRLQAAGFTDVQNLEGSIFQWANEHRPLVREGERVTVVHPYDALWGRLLAKEVRAPLKK